MAGVVIFATIGGRVNAKHRATFFDIVFLEKAELGHEAKQDHNHKLNFPLMCLPSLVGAAVFSEEFCRNNTYHDPY